MNEHDYYLYLVDPELLFDPSNSSTPVKMQKALEVFWAMRESYSYSSESFSLTEIKSEARYMGNFDDIIDDLPALSAAAKRLTDKGIIERRIEDKISKFCFEENLDNTLERLIANQIVCDEEDIESVISGYRDEAAYDDHNSEESEKITADKKKIIEYLQHICNLESNIFSLKNRYIEVKKHRDDSLKNNIDRYLDGEKKYYQKIKSLVEKKQDTFNSVKEPELTDEIKLDYPEKPEEPVFNLKKPEEPAYKKPGLFNKKKVEIENAELKESYEKSLEQYNQEQTKYEEYKEKYEKDMQEYNIKVKEIKEEEKRQNNELYQKKLEIYNELKGSISERIKEIEDELDNLKNNKDSVIYEMASNNKGFKEVADAEYELKYIKQEIKKNIDAENQLYSCGVVYGKYRHYVAVASFCDYLLSGRCSSLDGEHGAYNIYEQESRADEILVKLDDIIDSLDRIKQNQYYIYNEINEANKALSVIGGMLLVSNIQQAVQIEKLDEIINNTSETAYNTKVTAFYSKKNSQLLNALGFLTALK